VRDPYEVLGVARNATDAELKAAFKKLASRYHPDKNGNDPELTERFKEANAAYQILSDADKRAAWDRYGEAAFRPGGAQPFVDFSVGFDGIFGDILGAFGIRGGDKNVLRHKLRLTFEEAALGCAKEIEFERVDACTGCKGSGAAVGTSVSACGACNGRGRVKFQQAMFPIAVERACSRCRGSGKIPESPCKTCAGSGLMKKRASAKLEIPAGIEHGSSRNIDGAGNRTSPSGPAGPVEVLVEVEPHPFFQREGDDISCRVPISFVQAALGGEVEVPTLGGKVKLRIPPCTQPGHILRIKGKGIQHRIRGGRGDQLVEVLVEIPTRISPKARELIEELGRELGEDVQPQQKTFVEKLKSLLG
jgi:molecular chaperone DnaJ